jgi:hypothetical protein
LLQRNETQISAPQGAIGTRQDIGMLDKALNGKVAALLSTLDTVLTAGDIMRAVDAACAMPQEN